MVRSKFTKLCKALNIFNYIHNKKGDRPAAESLPKFRTVPSKENVLLRVMREVFGEVGGGAGTGGENRSKQATVVLQE